jgi:hypothetical protein
MKKQGIRSNKHLAWRGICAGFAMMSLPYRRA